MGKWREGRHPAFHTPFISMCSIINLLCHQRIDRHIKARDIKGIFGYCLLSVTSPEKLSKNRLRLRVETHYISCLQTTKNAIFCIETIVKRKHCLVTCPKNLEKVERHLHCVVCVCFHQHFRRNRRKNLSIFSDLYCK